MSGANEQRMASGPPSDASDQSASKFTAVNGRSPPFSGGSAHGQGSPRESHSHSNVGTQNLANGVGSAHVSRNSSPNRRVSEDSNKRKRSGADYDSSASPESRSSQRPRVNSQQTQPDTLPSMTNGTTQASIPSHHGPSHSHSSSGERFVNANEQSFGGGRPSEGNSESETRLSEPFGKGNQQQAPPAPMGTQLHSPPPKYPENFNQQQPLQGIQPNLSAPLLQKQRKRNFANRTKTGCLTCRERKKKCDEAKPQCANCERGGFHCKGYSTQSSGIMKTTPQRDHHPIQAKNGMYESPSGPSPQYGQQSYVPPGPRFYNPHVHDRDPQGRPGSRDDSQHMRVVADPNAPPNAPPAYGQPQWHERPSVPYHDTGRPEYAQVMPPIAADPSRENKRLPPPPGVMQPQSQASTQASTSPYNNHRGIAQLALQQDQSQYQYQSGVEKTNMLNQREFDHNDPALKMERKKCIRRTGDFNRMALSAEIPPDSVKTNLLRQIIKPDPEPGQSPQFKDLPTGHLGERVELQAPFYCDYGYNIQICDDTEIGRNCDIGDACTVKIGARCIIGPSVKFCSQDGVHHPKMPRPPGSKRLARAKPIFVGDDVFIGAGSIVLGGANIEAGCTVGAGTIVRGHAKTGSTVINNNEMRVPRGSWTRSK